jgi:hypothetical protein
MPSQITWPIYVTDRYGHTIYMTEERWRHAKRHRGMSDEILPKVLTTLRESKRHRDKYQFDDSITKNRFVPCHLDIVKYFRRQVCF